MKRELGIIAVEVMLIAGLFDSTPPIKDPPTISIPPDYNPEIPYKPWSTPMGPLGPNYIDPDSILIPPALPLVQDRNPQTQES